MQENGSISIKDADILVGPHQVAFDITNLCNFRCLHCYNASGENQLSNDELSDEEVLEFAKDLADMNIFNMCFCGGEPLLRKELIYKCAEIFKEKGIIVSMVTNGFLLTEEIAIKLKESGVSRVQISLDGARPESHDRLRNKKGAFEKAIGALKILKKLGMHSGIAFTPTSFNVDEVEEVHKIVAELETEGEMRTQPLMLLGRANSNLLSIMPTDMQYRKFIKKINEINNRGVGPYIQWGDPIDHLIRFRTTASHCVNFCNVRANGDIAVSAYLPLAVGNIKRHKFGEYWEAGLCKIWTHDSIKKMANNITCIAEMGKPLEELPVVWKDNDIFIDLIDDADKFD